MTVTHTWDGDHRNDVTTFEAESESEFGDSLQRGVVAETEKKVTKSKEISKNGDCDRERTYINTSLEQNEQMMIMTKRKTQMIKHITICLAFLIFTL